MRPYKDTSVFFFETNWLDRSLFSSKNADALLVACDTVELDDTVDQCEQGVILADTDTGTGMNVGTSLSDDNVASDNRLTVSLLDTKSLRIGVTAVLGRTDTFLMSKEL